MIPSIPNIPTDNLYKFMALSGVILLTVYVIGLGFIDYYAEMKALEHDKEYKKFEIEEKSFDRLLHEDQTKVIYGLKTFTKDTIIHNAIDSLFPETSGLLFDSLSSGKIDYVFSLFNKSNVIPNKLLNYSNDFKKIRTEYDSSENALLLKMHEKSIEMEYISGHIHYVSKFLKTFKWFFIGISALSSILLVFGFSLWYFKLQKYQDIIIKKQAESTQKRVRRNSIWK